MRLKHRNARSSPKHIAASLPTLLTLGLVLAFDVAAQLPPSPPANPAPPPAAPPATPAPAPAAAAVPTAATAATAAVQADAVVLEPVTVTDQRDGGYAVRSSASATKLDLSPRETPQSMTIITRQRMDDQDLTNIRDVLDNTPGIYSNAYDTERVLFYSRGFLIDTLMYDSVPALSNFNTGSIDETLDTAPYERIEVVRGATGLMTGTGNPAASINLIRKHADSRTPMFTLDLTAASWRDGRAVIDASTPLNADGSVRARVVGVAEDSESYQDLYRKKTYVGYGIVDADLGKSSRLSVGYNYQDNQPRSNTWGSFPLFLSNGQLANWPTSVTTATDWSYWNRKTQTAFVEFDHDFDNGWKLKSTYSYRKYNEDLELFYVYGFPDPQTGLGLDPYAYKSQAKITENALDVYASGPFELFGRRHELVVGYNGSRAKNTSTENEPVGDLPPTGNFFQWNGSYPHPMFGDATPLSSIDTDQDAVYATARFSLADPLHLIVGARYAKWKIDSFYVYDDPVDSSYDFARVLPYAGVVWDFAPQYSAFASYTANFKPQNARDIGGSYLDPIDGKSYEIGVKGEHFNRRLTTALTLFETRQNNIAAPVLDPDTGEPVLFPDGSAVSRAIDGIKTRGFELEVAGRLTEEVQGTLGWTHYRMEDGSGQAVRTFIPSTLVRAFATWQPRSLVKGLTLGAGINWQSDTSTVVGSPDGAVEFRQGDVTLVSLMARYQITRNASLQFNANNVFDKKYFVLDEYDNTYYGAPANYALSLRVSYD